jgi:hypothetical protein
MGDFTAPIRLRLSVLAGMGMEGREREREAGDEKVRRC